MSIKLYDKFFLDYIEVPALSSATQINWISPENMDFILSSFHCDLIIGALSNACKLHVTVHDENSLVFYEYTSPTALTAGLTFNINIVSGVLVPYTDSVNLNIGIPFLIYTPDYILTINIDNAIAGDILAEPCIKGFACSQ